MTIYKRFATMKVKVLVKTTSEQGKYCLTEIHGLTESMEIIGEYNPENNAVDFIWNGLDAMLWVGDNCEITERMQIEYSVADTNSLYAAATSENYFDDLAEAKAYKSENGGHLFFGASWISERTGDYVNPPYFGKTEQGAINKLLKSGQQYTR